MFIEILRKIDPNNSNCNKMKYYLNRHIELDSDLHGPIAQKMVVELCSKSSKKWDEALEVAKKCLHQRINLWDTILELINKKTIVV